MMEDLHEAMGDIEVEAPRLVTGWTRPEQTRKGEFRNRR